MWDTAGTGAAGPHDGRMTRPPEFRETGAHRAAADQETNHSPYLAGLRLAGRRVVVLGAGVVATRRIPVLLEAGAEVQVIAPHATSDVRHWHDRGELAWRHRRYAGGDLSGAWYVLVATDDPRCNEEASAEAERGQIFCVRSDDRHAATAWTPATAEVDGITVGILSGGDPRRSRWVRDVLVARLAELGGRVRRLAA